MTGDQRRWANEPGISGIVRVFDPYKYRSPLYVEGDSDAVRVVFWCGIFAC